MATALSALRALLNDELGLSSDSDNRFGSANIRSQALADAIKRLWPTCAKLITEDVTTVTSTVDYELSDVWDIMAIEVHDSASTIEGPTQSLGKYRSYRDESDASASILTLSAPLSSTQSLRVIGWAPYDVVIPGTDASETDVPSLMLPVVTAGARAILYRRRLNQFVDYEQHKTATRSTLITPEQMLTMWTAADREYRDGMREWQRGASEPKTASWAPRR